MPVHHRPRRHGTSKYTNLKRLPRTIYDLFGFRWYRRRHLGLNGDGAVTARST
jgi:dolichol-phosphate mannosyltransferase